MFGKVKKKKVVIWTRMGVMFWWSMGRKSAKDRKDSRKQDSGFHKLSTWEVSGNTY